MKIQKIALSALFFAATLTTYAQEAATPQPKGEVVALSEADFAKKIYNFQANPSAWKFEGDKPAVVDFYATWCGPCKKLAPIMDELAKTYAGKVDFYKVDVDKARRLAQGFALQSIPAVLIIPKEGMPQMVQGFLPKEEWVPLIEKFCCPVKLETP